MKLPGIPGSIHVKHGRYYKVAGNRWIPLSRVADGMRALLAALDGHDQAPQLSGFQRAIADYLKHHLPTLTPAVRKEHERMFGKIAACFAEFASVADVRPKHCLDLLDAFNDRKSARQAYKYRLSAFFSWCVVQELIEVNPLREITLAGPTRKKTPWTDALFVDAGALFEPMMQCYHELSYLLIQRTTDVRELERAQIVNDDIIRFLPSKTADSSGAAVDVRITPPIRAVLDRAEALRKKMEVISPYVICTSAGTAYTRSGIYSAYRRADELLHGKGKVIGLNAKAIRPYASTKAEAQGYNLRELQTRLAHTTQGTTEGYIQRHAVPISEISLRLPVKKEGKY